MYKKGIYHKIVSMSVFVFLLSLLNIGEYTWAKNQVERPLKIKGTVISVIDMSTGYYEMAGSGIATHTGIYENQGTGYTGFFGSGVLTASNGDEVYWISDETNGPENAVITILDGTGRFKNASGGFIFSSITDLNIRYEDEKMIVSYSFTGIGTIKY